MYRVKILQHNFGTYFISDICIVRLSLVNPSSVIRNVVSCLLAEYHICVSGLRLFVWRRWSNVWSKGELKSLESGEDSTKIRLSYYYRIAVKWWLELCQARASQPKTWSRSLRYSLVCRSTQNIGGYPKKIQVYLIWLFINQKQRGFFDLNVWSKFHGCKA